MLRCVRVCVLSCVLLCRKRQLLQQLRAAPASAIEGSCETICQAENTHLLNSEKVLAVGEWIVATMVTLSLARPLTRVTTWA